MVKFAHLADLHLGSWRERRLRELNFQAFSSAVDRILEENVDFCVFSGDIFNSASPPIEVVTRAANEFIRLKNKGVNVFFIGGSHDYSATGKSYLDLLETTGVIENACRISYEDERVLELDFLRCGDVLLAGLPGKKNGLDRKDYKKLRFVKKPECSYSVFLFHLALDDFKPDFLKNQSFGMSEGMLPPGFSYYAGGHVHKFMEKGGSSGKLVYPGPMFPNSFKELKTEIPSFCFVELGDEVSVSREFVNVFSKKHIFYEADKEMPSSIYSGIMEKLEGEDLVDCVVLLEISGVVEGAVSDIGMVEITKKAYELGAYEVLKNTHGLTSSHLREIEEFSEEEVESVEEIEDKVVREYIEDEEKINKLKSLLSLDLEMRDEEKVLDYDKRVKEAIKKCL